MRVVVTGALGHIGSRLIRELPRLLPGIELLLVDDLSTQRYASLFDLPREAQVRFIPGDVLKVDLLPVISGADAVIHLAAITDAPSSFERKEDVERVNLQGTRKVAEACLASGVALIFPSTTSVYGTQESEVDEDCPPEQLKPQSPYAESKLASERDLQILAREKGFRASILRLGTIFGISPGMRFHTAVNKFCWQAAMGLPITVWRTALHQHRPYLDLRDAVRAFAFVLGRKLYDGRVYNVVTTNTSVRGILDIVSKHRPDLSIEYVDSAIMNQLSYHVRSARFQGLGFQITGSLEEGIADTMNLLKGLRL